MQHDHILFSVLTFNDMCFYGCILLVFIPSDLPHEGCDLNRRRVICVMRGGLTWFLKATMQIEVSLSVVKCLSPCGPSYFAALHADRRA